MRTSIFSVQASSGRFSATIALAIGAVLFVGQSANAQTSLTTFAQFTSPDPSDVFQFTNNGASSTLSLNTEGTGGAGDYAPGQSEVLFSYETPNGYYSGSTSPRTYETGIYAYFTLTAQVSGEATDSGGVLTQGLQNIQMTFVAESAGSSYTNLLTVNFASGSITGGVGGGNPTFSASSGASFDYPDDFSSDYLDFSQVTQENFSISMSGANNSTGGGTAITQNANGYLDSFSADGTGTFSSNPPPPAYNPTPATPGELSLLAGVLVGAVQFGGARLRRNRKSNITAA